MGLLGLVMAPAQAAAVLVVPSLVTNVWQLLAGPALLALARRLAPMLLAMCAGTALGIGVLTSGASALPTLGLGAVLVTYALVGLFLRRLSVPAGAEGWASPVVGLLTGVITGATGIFAIPAVPYLSALGLAREELIQALGLSFTVSTAALVVSLYFAGSYSGTLAWSSVVAVLPAVAGMLAGQAVRQRLEPQAFRKGFFIAMLAIGIYMVLRAVARL